MTALLDLKNIYIIDFSCCHKRALSIFVVAIRESHKGSHW